MSRRILCKILLVVVAILGLFVLSGVLSAQGNSETAFERVRAVQERHTNSLMAIKGVVGTAIGLDGNAHVIKVLVEEPGVAGIPKKLGGVPVQPVVTGKIYALKKPDKPGKPPKPEPEPPVDPTARFDRPVPIGVSTGHPAITAGTIGCRVIGNTTGNVYALSNNHVYANENKANLGDNVLQPGTYDGGVDPDDAIGTLADFEPIVFHPRANNTIDAAIALTTTGMLGNATPSDGYGTPSSDIFEGDLLNLEVQKYGRTTGLTTGQVTGINATVRVRYSSGSARFVGQIIIEPGGFSAGGDSGSLIVTNDESCNPVGLLFAGSSTVTIANRIDLVLARFGVTVDGTTAGEPPVLTTIEVSPSSVTLYVAETQEFTATGKDQHGYPIETGAITWASSNTAVGTIDSSGLFTAAGAGTTTVSATGDGGVSGTADVTVTVTEVPVLTTIEVLPSSVTLYVGETQQFTATGSFDDGSTADLTSTATWASSNTAVATVDASGLATGIAAGTTDITATQDGVTSNTAALDVTPATTTDTVTITKAEYNRRKAELNVEATSSEGGPDVILWVYGYDGVDYTVDYGPMTYDSRKDKYKLKVKSVGDPGGFVVVISNSGGSATKEVKYK